MSAEFQPPQDPTLLEQARQLMTDARTALGRAAAAGLLVAGRGTVIAGAEAVVVPTVAHADALTDTYPDKNDACKPSDVISPPQTPTKESPYVSCTDYNWGVPIAGGGFSLNSTRGYGYRNCTDWVAYRANTITGGATIPSGLGNAKDWPSHYPASAVSATPVAGDVAVSTSGTYGHVAFVESVDSADDTMVVSEYNHDEDGDGDERTLPTSGSEFSEFINVGINMGSGSGDGGQYKDGTFLQIPSGSVFEVVGGAPIGLPNWDSVGGQKPVTNVTQATIDAMPQVPEDGTFVQDYGQATVFEMAGGAALGVGSWNDIDGKSHPTVVIPQHAFQQYPDNGTYVQEYDSQTVFEIVGGSALGVPSWTSVGDGTPQHVAMIPDGWINQFAPYPADGTFVRAYGTQTDFEMAGGAAFGVHNWNEVGGQQPDVQIPAGPIPYPTQSVDGTYVRPYGSNSVYVSAGGAAFGLPNWDSVGGEHPVASIPTSDLGQFLPEPRDGTFVQDYGNITVWEVAGGAAIPLPNWASVGGNQPVATVPVGAVEHLPTTPANGTFVQPYGSGTVEEIAGGKAFPLPSWSSVGGQQPVDQVPAGTTFANTIADGTYIAEYGSQTVSITAGDAALAIPSWGTVGGPQPFTVLPTGAIANNLLPTPANGTYVMGYTSGEEFGVENGVATQVTTSPLPPATTIDDWAIVNQLGGTD